MALGLNFGTGSAGDGDSLLIAFTSINNMFSTTTKLSAGDLTINDVRVGRGAGNNVSNTVVGNNALASNTGINNTAIGNSALAANTNGGYNTAVGISALQANIGGTANTAIGNGSAVANQGGNSNTSLGSDTLFSNVSGDNNTAIGKGALQNSTSGNNTAIGQNAGAGATNQSNSTCIGYSAQVDGSNQIQLGSGTTTCYTYGALNNRSDERDKTEVRDTVLGLDFVNSLRAVDYKWDMREDYRAEIPTQGDLSKEEYKIVMDEWLESVKLDNITHDGTHTRTRYHHGLIAQEVQDVIEASGVDFGGFQDHSVNGGQDVLSLGYTELIAPMIKAIQELTARINVLEGN